MTDVEQSTADDLVGATLDGRYRIEQLLGSGAMGSVYRGTHQQLRKSVAIKVLHREMTLLPEVVARFEREAVAAARVEHPNIAKAMDFGKMEDGGYYLALEYVEGQSLRKAIHDGGPMPPSRAVHIAREISDALAAAHALGIVHRDLKPDNVMLIEEGGGEAVKVLDFGIAKVTADDFRDQPALTQAGTVFGTPEYMAPEQAKGLPVDARADLYAVGIILYEMLVGRTPFGGDDLVVVLTRQMTEPPPPLPATVDPQLAELVAALLAKEPEARVQTAGELVARLDAVGQRALGEASPSPAPAVSGTGETVLSSADPSLLSAPSAEAPSSPGSAPQTSPSPPVAAQTAHVLMAPQADTMLAAPKAGRAGLGFMSRTTTVGGREVPLWMLAASAGGALLLVFAFSAIVAIALSGGEESTSGKGSASGGIFGRKKDEEALKKLLAEATRGDPAALEKLEERPAAGRAPAEWYALGRGRAARGNRAASLDAYSKAIAGDSKLADDKHLLSDLRRAADDPAIAERALRLAATAGSSGGLDVVYDVWATTKKKEIKKLAWKLVSSKRAEKNASPALKVAVGLYKAKRCGQYRALLPSAVEHADGRATKKLVALTRRRGCGFLRLGDCFSCLRSSKDLSEAIKTAKARPGPTFEAPRDAP